MILPPHYSANWSSYNPFSLATFPPKCIFFNSEAHQAASHIQTPSYFLFVYVNVSYPLPLSILSTLGAKIYHFFLAGNSCIASPTQLPKCSMSPGLLHCLCPLPCRWSQWQMVGQSLPSVTRLPSSQGDQGRKIIPQNCNQTVCPKTKKTNFLTKYAQTNHSNF